MSRRIAKAGWLVFFLALLWAGPALGQSVGPPCNTHENALAYLNEKHGETLRIIAVTANGGWLEITVNETTGTYTILVTYPGQQTCIRGSGDGWRDIEPLKGETGA